MLEFNTEVQRRLKLEIENNSSSAGFIHINHTKMAKIELLEFRELGYMVLSPCVKNGLELSSLLDVAYIEAP